MGLGKSKPKKPDPASASGRSSTAWGDAPAAEGQNGRGRNVARPNLQQFKSSSAPSSRVNGVRNGASNTDNREDIQWVKIIGFTKRLKTTCKSLEFPLGCAEVSDSLY